jgi:hypothetical protein
VYTRGVGLRRFRRGLTPKKFVVTGIPLHLCSEDMVPKRFVVSRCEKIIPFFTLKFHVSNKIYFETNIQQFHSDVPHPLDHESGISFRSLATTWPLTVTLADTHLHPSLRGRRLPISFQEFPVTLPVTVSRANDSTMVSDPELSSYLHPSSHHRGPRLQQRRYHLWSSPHVPVSDW